MTNYLNQECPNNQIKTKTPAITIILYICAIIAAIATVTVVCQNIILVIQNIENLKTQYATYGQELAFEFTDYLNYFNYVFSEFVSKGALTIILLALGSISKKVYFIYEMKKAKINAQACEEKVEDNNSDDLTENYQSIFDSAEETVEEDKTVVNEETVVEEEPSKENE